MSTMADMDSLKAVFGTPDDIAAQADAYRSLLLEKTKDGRTDLSTIPLSPYGGYLASAEGSPFPSLDSRISPSLSRMAAATPMPTPKASATDGTTPAGSDPKKPRIRENFSNFEEFIAYAHSQLANRPKFPGIDGSLQEYVDWAKFEIIQKAVDKASKKLKEEAKEFLIEILREDIPMALAQASAGSGASGGLVAVLTGAYDDIKNSIKDVLKTTQEVLEDPSKLLDIALEKNWIQDGIASVLKSQLGDLFEVDDSSSLGAQLADKYLRAFLEEQIDKLLENVMSLDDLIANFDKIQSDIMARVKQLCCGEDFVKTFAAARLCDPDDKVDLITSGSADVITECSLQAKVLDTLAPSGKVLVSGSSTVLVNGKFAARVSSLTAIPSVIKTGAAEVYIGGDAAAVDPPVKKPPRVGASSAESPDSGSSAAEAGVPGENEPTVEGQPENPSKAEQPEDASVKTKEPPVGETEPEGSGPSNETETDKPEDDATLHADKGAVAASEIDAEGQRQKGAELDKEKAEAIDQANAKGERASELEGAAEQESARAKQLDQEAAGARATAGESLQEHGEAVKATDEASKAKHSADVASEIATDARATADDAAKAAKNLPDSSSVPKNSLPGKVAGALGTAGDIKETADAVGEMKNAGEEGRRKDVVGIAGGATGNLGGGMAGAKAGAELAVAVCKAPPPIALACGVVLIGGGAIVGSLAGESVGTKAGCEAADAMGIENAPGVESEVCK